MGTVGDALENAVAHLAQAIFEWIEVFYNQQRRHSTLGPLTYANAPSAPPAA
jgi:transposase InsO family protein